MKNRKSVSGLILLLVFVLAACGNATPEAMEKPAGEMMDKATEEAMMTEEPMMTKDAMMTEEPMMTEEAMLEMPAWFGASLKDVRTGESFKIEDFKGKVVLVETMAVWCPTCKQQQAEIKSLYESLGMREDLVIVSLDIDPNEDEAILTGYTEENGDFGWRYAVTGAEVAREIGNMYGDQFLNPPSAPILVIDRHGEAHPLPFGLKSMEELKEMIQPYLDAKM